MTLRKMARMLAMLSALLPGTAFTADWVVTKVSQPSRYSVDGKTWKTVTKGLAIPNEGWLSTGPRGRVVLERAKDRVTFQPGTLAGIFERAGKAVHTDFTQQTGTLELSIDPKVKPHLAVQTPYLAAVVKGTIFSVSIGRKNASVSVDRGRVEVTDRLSGERTGVRAGQKASVDDDPATSMALSGKNKTFEPVTHVAVPAPSAAAPAAPSASQSTASDDGSSASRSDTSGSTSSSGAGSNGKSGSGSDSGSNHGNSGRGSIGPGNGKPGFGAPGKGKDHSGEDGPGKGGKPGEDRPGKNGKGEDGPAGKNGKAEGGPAGKNGKAEGGPAGKNGKADGGPAGKNGKSEDDHSGNKGKSGEDNPGGHGKAAEDHADKDGNGKGKGEDGRGNGNGKANSRWGGSR